MTAPMVASVLTPDEARALTDEIRDTVDNLWQLIERAHAGKAYKALGYTSWADYVRAEFNMSESRSYQLLDQARVIRAIERATSTDVEITEAAARDLAPILPLVTAEVRERVASGEPADIVVPDVVARARKPVAPRPAPKTKAMNNLAAAFTELAGSLELLPTDEIDPNCDVDEWLGSCDRLIAALKQTRRLLLQRRQEGTP